MMTHREHRLKMHCQREKSAAQRTTEYRQKMTLLSLSAKKSFHMLPLNKPFTSRRSSHQEVFCKKCVCKFLVKILEKCLWRSSFFVKLQALKMNFFTGIFQGFWLKISKDIIQKTDSQNTYIYITPLTGSFCDS